MQFLIVVTSPDKVVQVEPSHFEERTIGKVDDPLYVVVQPEDVGSVMHAFNAVRSTLEVEAPAREIGIVPAAPYVARHEVEVGSVMQLFIVDTSVVVVSQVVLSHFPERTFGIVVEAEYVVVQADAVGSVIQLFIGVTSVAVAARTLGNVVAAP